MDLSPAGKMKPVIDKELPLSRRPKAFHDPGPRDVRKVSWCLDKAGCEPFSDPRTTQRLSPADGDAGAERRGGGGGINTGP